MRAPSFLLLAAVLALGCAPIMKAAGFPPQATRKTPPLGLEATALPVGASSPALTVAMTDGTSASLSGQPTVLVFYRGQW